jgi:hypothetical protein
MAQAVVRIEGLPEAPLDAAAAFHVNHLAAARAVIAAGSDAVLLFAPAEYEHRGWRLAAVQDLAREAAPLTVNGLVGDDETALSAALSYLAGAPGITGQLLAV